MTSDVNLSPLEQHNFTHALDKVNKVGSALKIIAWALGTIAIAGLSVAYWVWGMNTITHDTEVKVKEITPRVASLEARAIRVDATPAMTQAQYYELDKRLDMLGQQYSTLREQNTLILQEVRKGN